MCWVPAVWADRQFETEILQSTNSDHNPILLTINGRKRRSVWRLDPRYLKNHEFKGYLQEEMKWYFITNMMQGGNIQNVWDAGKAYLCSNNKYIFANEENAKQKDDRVDRKS